MPPKRWQISQQPSHRRQGTVDPRKGHGWMRLGVGHYGGRQYTVNKEYRWNEETRRQ